MRRTVKGRIFSALDLCRVPEFYRKLNRRGIAVLVYHGFSDRACFEGIENYDGKHLGVGHFREQIRYVSRRYRVLPLGEIVRHWNEGRALPPHAAAITIDDGYESTYNLAYPVLREFDVPATVFVATDFVDRKEPLWTDRVEFALNATRRSSVTLEAGSTRLVLDLSDPSARLAAMKRVNRSFKTVPQEQLHDLVSTLERACEVGLDGAGGQLPDLYAPLTWAQVKEMQESGLVTIGSHTAGHVILSRCRPDTMARELSVSRQVVQDRTGHACDLFCYPNGTPADFDDRTRRHLVGEGYSCGVTMIPGLNRSGSDVMALKRVGAPPDGAAFRVTVSGLKALLGSGRRSLPRGRAE